MDDNEERWVSIGQAARMLGVGRPAIYGRIKRGTLPARRSNEDGAWQVAIDSETVAATEAIRERDESRGDDVTVLRIENGRLEERLAAVERELADKVVRLDRTEAELASTREKLIAEMGRSIWSRLFSS
jgi:hypothetical protein